MYHLNKMLNMKNTLSSSIYLFNKSASSTLAGSGSLKEEKIKVQNYDISYVKVGTGDHHVLFLPGVFGTKWTHGTPLIERFNRDKFTLIAWDAPGCGKSRPPNKEFAMDSFKSDADVSKELMQELGISKYSILGYSGGGATAIIHAAKYPENVNKLVIWSFFTIVTPYLLSASKKYLDVKLMSEDRKKEMFEIYGQELYIKYWASLVKFLEDTYKNGGDICTEYVKNIKCPTFVLYGQQDPFVDVALHLPHVLEHLRGPRVHIYPEGKHNMQANYAENFYKRVEEFLLEPLI